jgi:hypothetical protein
LGLLDESPYHNDAPAAGGNIERPSDPVSPRQSHFPQLALQVLHIRLAEGEQAEGFYPLGQAQKPRLHIGRKFGNLAGHRFAQGFDAPPHLPFHNQAYFGTLPIRRRTQSIQKARLGRHRGMRVNTPVACDAGQRVRSRQA